MLVCTLTQTQVLSLVLLKKNTLPWVTYKQRAHSSGGSCPRSMWPQTLSRKDYLLTDSISLLCAHMAEAASTFFPFSVLHMGTNPSHDGWPLKGPSSSEFHILVYGLWRDTNTQIGQLQHVAVSLVYECSTSSQSPYLTEKWFSIFTPCSLDHLHKAIASSILTVTKSSPQSMKFCRFSLLSTMRTDAKHHSVGEVLLHVSPPPWLRSL